MLKLYKHDKENFLYWKTWDKDKKTGIVHWGNLGEKGHVKEIVSGLFSNFRKQIQKEIDQKLSEGYREIDINNHITLLVEYSVDGMGTAIDLEKRHRLENKLNEILGWTGLGHCDGGSIGGGTMEVCCYVVDFILAKKVIEEKLTNTEFSNYTKICDENA